MSDHDVAPDPVVRTALQLLPVPPHADDFWTTLEAALDAEEPLRTPQEPVRRLLVADPAAAATSAPAPVDLASDRALALVPPTFRRASNAVLVAVAAAAVVIVAVAGTTLLEDRRGTEVRSGGTPSADQALETLVRDAQSGATVSTLSDRHEDASADAVLAWVADLGQGDAEGAWAAMGDASQHHFASRAEFEGLMTDLAEGYGAWSAAEPDDVLVTPVSASDEGTIAVVTLVGTVEQEGSRQARADAFPVRVLDGEVILEPFASAGDLEIVIPEPVDDTSAAFEAVGLHEELVFVLPASAEAPVLQIDGGVAVLCGEAPGTDLHDLEGTTGQRCSYLPDGGFDAGDHIVTVAFLGSDGSSITAESLRFHAA